ERLLLLLVLTLGFFSGFAFFTFPPALLLTLLAFLLALALALSRGPLLLGAIFMSSQLPPILARLLLVLLDDGLDHALEPGAVDAVFLSVALGRDVKHPLDGRQPRQPFDLNTEPVRALFFGCRKGNDGLVHRTTVSATPCASARPQGLC